MTTLTFEIEASEVKKIKAVLKALGVRKLKIESEPEVSARFEEKLRKSKAGGGTELVTKQDVSNFFSSI